jgi:omega-6 fatty acid desaturase (delta-12 desaturase)
VHHLSSRVPLYNMRACLRENPALAKHNRISLFDALRSLRLAVWDEERGVLTKI